MFRKLTLTSAIAVAAVALSCGAAYAAADAPAGASAAHAHGWGHHGHGGFEKQLEKLHAELKLNPQQDALWKSAVDTMHANHQQMRAQRETNKAQMKAAMQQPILDLAAMHAAREQQAQQNHQLREQTTQAWLNVYAALDDQQKTIVSTAMKTRWQKFAQRAAAMREHWEKNHANAASAAQQ